MGYIGFIVFTFLTGIFIQGKSVLYLIVYFHQKLFGHHFSPGPSQATIIESFVSHQCSTSKPCSRTFSHKTEHQFRLPSLRIPVDSYIYAYSALKRRQRKKTSVELAWAIMNSNLVVRYVIIILMIENKLKTSHFIQKTHEHKQKLRPYSRKTFSWPALRRHACP